MSYWQLFYHLIWATKHRELRLTEEIEPVIHGFVREKAIGLGAYVFALDGVADHVHMVVAIPPKIAVAKFVGQVKGVASTKFNKSGVTAEPFFWQDDYGAFSFDAKRLSNYIAYVNRQKEHHAHATAIPILERTAGDGPRHVLEASAPYPTQDRYSEALEWRRELEGLA